MNFFTNGLLLNDDNIDAIIHSRSDAGVRVD